VALGRLRGGVAGHEGAVELPGWSGHRDVDHDALEAALGEQFPDGVLADVAPVDHVPVVAIEGEEVEDAVLSGLAPVYSEGQALGVHGGTCDSSGPATPHPAVPRAPGGALGDQRLDDGETGAVETDEECPQSVRIVPTHGLAFADTSHSYGADSRTRPNLSPGAGYSVLHRPYWCPGTGFAGVSRVTKSPVNGGCHVVPGRMGTDTCASGI